MQPPTIVSWNVRGLLGGGRVHDCQRLVKDFQLDMCGLLETKLNSDSLSDSVICRNINLFPFEHSCHNFDISPGGRILVKWNSS